MYVAYVDMGFHVMENNVESLQSNKQYASTLPSLRRCLWSSFHTILRQYSFRFVAQHSGYVSHWDSQVVTYSFDDFPDHKVFPFRL